MTTLLAPTCFAIDEDTSIDALTLTEGARVYVEMSTKSNPDDRTSALFEVIRVTSERIWLNQLEANGKPVRRNCSELIGSQSRDGWECAFQLEPANACWFRVGMRYILVVHGRRICGPDMITRVTVTD